MFRRYCYSCHSSDDPSGNVDLESDVDLRLIRNSRQKWLRVREALATKVMPPEDEVGPDEETRTLMLDFVDETFSDFDCQAVDDPGPPVLRRLNRTQYDNVVYDLTGLDLQLAQQFPPDPSSYGFDTIGSALRLTPAQVELYHAAAKQIVSRVLAGSPTSLAVANDGGDSSRADNSLTVEGRRGLTSGQIAAARRAYYRIFGQVASPGTAPNASGSPAAAPRSGSLDASRAEPQRAADRVILESFARNAFRGPVEPGYVDRLLEIVAQARQQGATDDVAVGHALTAILISPRFLMRVEMDRPDVEGSYPVDDYELASRLSFFIWSRGPDRDLLKLAESQQLHAPEVLKQQVERMLSDPRSEALVDNFFAQWLGFGALQEHQPAADSFPEFDTELRNAMHQEVRLVLLDIVQRGESIFNLIDTDYSYLNRRLARHYQQSLGDQVSTTVFPQEEFVRTELPDRRRGGVLFTAAMLMIHSDPDRTNIPKRGNFLAGQILGDPPPPPPPDVPPLTAVDDGKLRTTREMFQLHRSSPDCQGCHQEIDPLGFSLEHFDAIGRWREEEQGVSIDASAHMPGGSDFYGPAGLKDYLLSRSSEITRNFARNLLIYAVGRGLQSTDECVIKDMIEASEATDGSLTAMIQALASSPVFTHRKNPEY